MSKKNGKVNVTLTQDEQIFLCNLLLGEQKENGTMINALLGKLYPNGIYIYTGEKPHHFKALWNLPHEGIERIEIDGRDHQWIVTPGEYAGLWEFGMDESPVITLSSFRQVLNFALFYGGITVKITRRIQEGI